MNKLYTVFLFLTIMFLSLVQAHAGQKLRVYFIGNSYTNTNDLPKMIADIAASMGDMLVYEEHTPGGWTLKDHWNPPTDPCVGKVKTGNWDYVILQEQSQLPAFGVLNPSHPTYIYAGQFTKLIRDSAKCTTAMFYMTWGYKNGDASNCPGLPYMCTYQGMDSVLRARYTELADSFDAVLSPVGAVRRYIRDNHPGIELYQADGSHPEVTGTYAAACSFYAALFKKEPSLITFNSTLPAADASDIRTAAKTVVYDSLSKWGLGIYDLVAAYDFSISSANATFNNNSSLLAQTYSWNFGDGNTSTLKNPVHSYTTSGDYTVTLTAYNASGCSKSISKKLTILPNSIQEVGPASFTITPNPATASITIQSAQQLTPFNIRITSAIGQTMYLATVNSSTNMIDLSAFSNGMYYITMYNDTAVLHYDKFIKQ
jgi:PKD repeat protein